jgi:hypothetical protein
MKGMQRAGKNLVAGAKRVFKDDPHNKLIRAIGDAGGIKYHKNTNPITGVKAKVRGNINKQSPIPGFNRPNSGQMKEFNAANTGKANAGKRVGNALVQGLGPILWTARGQQPRKR